MTETSEQLARLFHETYEELAPHHGYRTREESAKPWADVPEQNKALMIATCERVLAEFKAELRRAEILRRGVANARDTAQRERDQLVEVIARLMSLPPKTVADAYGVEYTNREQG